MSPCRSRAASRTRPVLVVALLLLVPCLAAAGGEPLDSEAPARSRRIVGGFEATPGDWPWMAAIKHRGGNNFADQFCAGSLIRPRWVMTAAHCFYENESQFLDAGDIEVVLGLHDLVQDVGETFDASTLVIHPAYDPGSDDSDIALIELAGPSSAEKVFFEDVSVSQGLVDGNLLTAIGWGDTEPSSSGNPPNYPDALQQVQLPYISTASCGADPPYAGLVTDNMFCAGFPAGGKDTCQGDSGGPLMREVSGDWHLVGLTSWGFQCALPNRPGVLTKVANFTPWAQEIVPEPAAVVAQAAALLALAAIRGRGARGR